MTSPTMHLINLMREDTEESVAEAKAALEGRNARCAYARNTEDGQPHGKYGYLSKTVESHLGLAFFEYRPDADQDAYYCGCYGWD